MSTSTQGAASPHDHAAGASCATEVELLARLRHDVARAGRADQVLAAALPTCLVLLDAAAVELALSGPPGEAATASLRAGPGQRVVATPYDGPLPSTDEAGPVSTTLRGAPDALGRLDAYGVSDPLLTRTLASLAADIIALRLLVLRGRDGSPAGDPAIDATKITDSLTSLGNRTLSVDFTRAV